VVFTLVGKVIDATSFAPLKGVEVTLSGEACLFVGVPGAEDARIPNTPVVAWMRELRGFEGNRWQCWVKYVRDQVKGITWREFFRHVLECNPGLIEDGCLFQKTKTYLLPDNAPQGQRSLRTQTGDDGRYALTGMERPGEYELRMQLPGYNGYREVLRLVEDTQRNVPLAAQQSRVVSNHPQFAQLPDKVRRLVNQALSMLGDDHVVFDTLPPELQRLCHGVFYLDDPNSIYFKDICCADLVTICLQAAGLDYDWPADAVTGGDHMTPHAANYYRPWEKNSKLVELDPATPWLPGDILLYGNGDFATQRVQHVNLYVGRMSGVDRRGVVLRYGDRYEVVNASIDWMENGLERGTGIVPLTLAYCLNRRCDYQWVKRVRLVEVQNLYGV
jgi:phage tail protein X